MEVNIPLSTSTLSLQLWHPLSTSTLRLQLLGGEAVFGIMCGMEKMKQIMYVVTDFALIRYLQFATGEYFYDREEIRKDLRTRLLSGPCNVALYGPRRYGKSSLVAELTADLEKAGVPCVTIDIVKVPSIDLFVSAYAQKVSRRLVPVRFELRRRGELLKSLRPKMTVSGARSAGRGRDGRVSGSRGSPAGKPLRARDAVGCPAAHECVVRFSGQPLPHAPPDVHGSQPSLLQVCADGVAGQAAGRGQRVLCCRAIPACGRVDCAAAGRTTRRAR